MMRQTTTPRLTIVIPTPNRAHCLARAIDSELAQVGADIEILVSDVKALLRTGRDLCVELRACWLWWLDPQAGMVMDEAR